MQAGQDHAGDARPYLLLDDDGETGLPGMVPATGAGGDRGRGEVGAPATLDRRHDLVDPLHSQEAVVDARQAARGGVLVQGRRAHGKLDVPPVAEDLRNPEPHQLAQLLGHPDTGRGGRDPRHRLRQEGADGGVQVREGVGEGGRLIRREGSLVFARRDAERRRHAEVPTAGGQCRKLRPDPRRVGDAVQ